MEADLLALLDKPVLLLVILTIGAFIGIGIERLVEGQKRAERRAYWQGRNAKNPRRAAKSDYAKATDALLTGKTRTATSFAADQLRCVMEADFSSRALLNRPEALVFNALDAAVIARNPAW